jgi:hypothetical protein
MRVFFAISVLLLFSAPYALSQKGGGLEGLEGMEGLADLLKMFGGGQGNADLDKTEVNEKTGKRESPLYVDCPSGQLAVQEFKRPQSNGCSKPAGLDVPGEEDFTWCCDRHDVCYQVRHTRRRYLDLISNA